jgi:hypothetical protein
MCKRASPSSSPSDEFEINLGRKPEQLSADAG